MILATVIITRWDHEYPSEILIVLGCEYRYHAASVSPIPRVEWVL